LSILTDRSRIETDWACPRKRYWLTEHMLEPDIGVPAGTPYEPPAGIVSLMTSPALAFGSTVHKGLEYQILQETKSQHNRWTPMDEDIPGLEAVDVGLTHMQTYPEWDGLSLDQQDTAVALVTGFFQTVWPRWMEQYEPMAVEQELEFEQDGVICMVRPDLLLKDKKTGDIWYPDFKTFTSWNNRKWDWGLQQQLTLLACKKSLGVDITGAWIQGLGKGSGRKGVLYHPLVYGYRHPGTPGVTEPSFGTKRRAGFERFPVKEYPHGGVRGWVARLEEHEPELVAKVFPQSAPIFLKTELMGKEIMPQIVAREQQIAAIRAKAHEAPAWMHKQHFPMNITQCETGYGQCTYFDACHAHTLASYTYRVPHHKAEVDLCEQLSSSL
jgi:hypothetical protein